MRLILDAHISPAVARSLSSEGIDALAMLGWRAGQLRTAEDPEVLTAARVEGRVLVTYDLRTIPRLLQLWGAEGREHAGVILVDDRTILPNDIGGLIRALREVVYRLGDDDWTNRVIYLQPSRE